MARGRSSASAPRDFFPPERACATSGAPLPPSPATGNAAVHKRELEQFLGGAFTS